jgi:hypothetical protein
MVISTSLVPRAASKQCQLISIILRGRGGWVEWPSEDWFLSGGDEMLKRPAEARHMDFCNCGSYVLQFHSALRCALDCK